MRKMIQSTLALVCGALLSTSVWSYAVVDVVAVDTFVGTFDANGEPAEKAGFAQVLTDAGYSYDLSTFDKVDNNAGWGAVTGTTWAAKLDTSAPAFFSLKFGQGKLNGDDHYVYKNESSFDYLVVDLANLTGCYSLTCDVVDLSGQTFTVISHYEKIGSVTTSVPEPGSLALLGLGLIGLAATRRKLVA